MGKTGLFLIARTSIVPLVILWSLSPSSLQPLVPSHGLVTTSPPPCWETPPCIHSRECGLHVRTERRAMCRVCAPGEQWAVGQPPSHVLQVSCGFAAVLAEEPHGLGKVGTFTPLH